VPEHNDPAADASRSDQALDIAARLAGMSRQAPSASLFGRRPAADMGASRPVDFAETPSDGFETPTGVTPDSSPSVGAPVDGAPILLASDAATADTAAEPQAPAAPMAEASASAPIGRLTRVSASEMWTDDAELAGWLVHDPTLLGEAIGLGLLSAEHGASPNRLTAAAADASRVSIVAETGSSSERGLAGIVELASIGGSDAVVWLAGEVDDTHRASVSWLNRTTEASFFLVRVEGARIGPSATAALLEAVVRPPRAEDLGGTTPSDETGGRRAEDHVPEG
jgi:hypothetical protein